jgi:predicted SnoaL-like aldol condensation-catalyzing enzyme
MKKSTSVLTMTLTRTLTMTALLAAMALPVQAGTPVTAIAPASQQQLLQSADPQLAANKKLVFDFWREVIDAGQLDKAATYLTEGYIQHNPNIADGRAAFVAYFAQFSKPSQVQSQISLPLVNIIAEGPYVTLVFVQTLPDKANPGKTYTTTAFDLFRIADGKIAEHWDSMRKQ